MRVRGVLAGAAIALVAAAAPAAATEDHAAVHVTACQLAPVPDARQATFVARMHSVPGTEQMELRLNLRERFPGHTPALVTSPALGVWHRAQPGVADFSYTQTVDGLDIGAIYSMSVDFRWLDSTNHVIDALTRTSGACHEMGPLADLRVAGVSTAGGDATSEQYAVQVANDGRETLPEARVRVFVDRAPGGRGTLSDAAPGETRTVAVPGPRCTHRIRIVLSRPGDFERAVSWARCPMAD